MMIKITRLIEVDKYLVIEFIQLNIFFAFLIKYSFINTSQRLELKFTLID